jgi:hypothetical protein
MNTGQKDFKTNLSSKKKMSAVKEAKLQAAQTFDVTKKQ